MIVAARTRTIRELILLADPRHDPQIVKNFLKDMENAFPHGQVDVKPEFDQQDVFAWLEYCRKNEPLEFCDWIRKNRWKPVLDMGEKEIWEKMRTFSLKYPELFRILEEKDLLYDISLCIRINPVLTSKPLCCNFLLATESESEAGLGFVPAIFAKGGKHLDEQETDSAFLYVLDQLGLDVKDRIVQAEWGKCKAKGVCMTLCVQTDFFTLYKGFLKNSFTFMPGTRGGLFAPHEGAGGEMNMILDKPVIIPVNMICSIQPEQFVPVLYDGMHTVHNVCRNNISFWESTLVAGGAPPYFDREKFLDHASMNM